MHNKTLKQLSALLHAKEISSVELTRHYLDRIAQSDLNAYLHVDAERSLAQAKAADALLATGSAGALTGVVGVVLSRARTSVAADRDAFALPAVDVAAPPIPPRGPP